MLLYIHIPVDCGQLQLRKTEMMVSIWEGDVGMIDILETATCVGGNAASNKDMLKNCVIQLAVHKDIS